jgi:hypothetical protein
MSRRTYAPTRKLNVIFGGAELLPHEERSGLLAKIHLRNFGLFAAGVAAPAAAAAEMTDNVEPLIAGGGLIAAVGVVAMRAAHNYFSHDIAPAPPINRLVRSKILQGP